MAEVLSGPSLYEYTDGEPPSEEQLRRQDTSQSRGHSVDLTERWINELVVLQTTGEAIGYVQATVPFSVEYAEVAWVISSPWQGRGDVIQATALLVSQLAALGVRAVVAHIHPDHAASAAVARRLDMHPTNTVVDGEGRWEGAVSATVDGPGRGD